MQIAQQALQSYRRLFLVRGIIAIVFGVVVLVASPATTLLVLVYLFGAYAFVGGIVAAALALRYTKEQGWALLLVEGILGILAGIMQIVAAFTLPLGTGREWLLGLAGFFSILFGVLIAIRPVAGLVTVVWLIGIYAMVFGILFIVRYFQARSLASRLT